MSDFSLNYIVLRLLWNGLRYRCIRLTGNPVKPHAVSLEITSRCIARCVMCNIWKTSPDAVDLPIDDWIRLLASPLFSDLRELDVTGGEPFLRADLLEFIEVLPHLKETNVKGIKSVSITTNGFLTDCILPYVNKMVEVLAPGEIDLVIVCAMDGIGETHDRIRNYKGAWHKVDRTLQGLKDIRSSHQNLLVGLKTTVLPQNVDQLEEIARYAESQGLFTIISPCIITENRYGNVDRREELAFHQWEIEKMIRFYELEHFQWSFHRERLLNYFRTGWMKKPCSAGFNYLFVRSNGEIYPCPLMKIKLGNFIETEVGQIYLSEQANRFRKKVGKYPECRSCTEPGLERYALPFEGFTYLSLMMKMGKRDFITFHRYMGLDKYFL